MIGWKQAYTSGYENLVIVELDIPQDAKVEYIGKYGDTDGIYLCDKATVLSVSSFDKKHSVNIARSLKDCHFKYKVGEEVRAEIDETLGDRSGIYFFKTREEAVKYEF